MPALDGDIDKRRLLWRLLFATAFQAEGHIAKVLAGRDDVIHGLQGSPVDLAMYARHGPLLGNDSTSRLLHALEDNPTEPRFLTLDVKTFMATIHTPSNIRKPHVWGWRIKYSNTYQEHVSAFCVVNPGYPDLVCLVPRNALDDTIQNRRSFAWSYPIVTLPPPFPLELSNYVMPLNQLPTALQSMKQWFLSSGSQDWVNPYNGNTLVTRGLPSLQPAQLLRVTQPEGHERWATRDDYASIQSLWKAFAAHSARFKVQNAVVKPLNGDILLVENLTGLVICIEIKTNICWIRKNGRGQPDTLMHSCEMYDRQMFNGYVEYDYLLTSLRGRGSEALIINVDDLGPDWFQVQGRKTIELALTDPEFVSDRLLDLRKPADLVRRIESHFDSRDSILAKRTMAMANFQVDTTQLPSTLDLYDATDNEDDMDDGDDDPGEASANFFRTSVFETSCLRALLELCARSKFGIIYALKENPAARFTFFPYSWTDKEQDTYWRTGKLPIEFVQIPPTSLMIYLTFGSIYLTDHPNGVFNSSRRWFRHFNYQECYHIVVVDPLDKVSFPNIDEQRNRYMIPSTCLISKYGEKGKPLPRGNSRHRIALAGNQALELYGKFGDELITGLQKLFDHSADGYVYLGYPGTDVQSAWVKASDFLYPQRDIAGLTQYANVVLGQWWSKRDPIQRGSARS